MRITPDVVCAIESVRRFFKRHTLQVKAWSDNELDTPNATHVFHAEEGVVFIDSDIEEVYQVIADVPVANKPKLTSHYSTKATYPFWT